MSMDGADDVFEHVPGIVASAGYHLESCFVVGSDYVHNLA
jgi:hypothetical protein